MNINMEMEMIAILKKISLKIQCQVKIIKEKLQFKKNKRKFIHIKESKN